MPWLVRRGAHLVLNLKGWQVVVEDESFWDTPKALIIGAPHTTNWDGFHAFLAAFALDMRFRWLGKDTLFRFPLGIISRMTGGIPIDRKKHQNAVSQSVELFKEYEHFFLMIAPEATRRKADHWKTGFYHIAQQAEVPLMLARLDYINKRVGVGQYYRLSGDVETDMQMIRTFLATNNPKFPEQASEVRLKDA